jgi:RPA family protein
MSDDPGQREVAHRLFAAEYDDANHSYSESEEERAPNYVVTPTGARVNRLFVVGVLTEVEQVSDDVLRGRVADPTGAFVLYAGQYQPDEQATLERTDPPAFVAVTGKADTFQPEDGDQVYTSIRPESINTVDAETRDRWTVQTAEQTLARVGHTATALSTGLAGEDLRETLTDRGLDPALADGIPRALAHYDTTPAYLDGIRELALDAARVVAGHRDEAGEMTASPDDPGDVTAHELVAATPETDLDGSRPALDESASETATGASANTAGPSETGAETTSGAETGAETASGTETGAETTSGTETAGDSRTATTSETTADSGPTSDPETESGTVDTAESSATADPETESGTVDTAESSATADPETESGAKATGGETATEVEAEPGDGTDDIAVETGADATGEELGEFDSGEFELPDDVREEVEEAEAEFGTSFQSGTEVEEPGEADIQTPETETAPEADATPTEPAESDAGTETTSAEPVDTEQVDTETAGGESADTEQVDTETASEGSVDTEPVDTETADGKSVDTGPVDTETADGGSVDTEPVDAETADGKSVDTGPVDTETADGESVDTGSTDVAEDNESESVEDPQAAVLAVMEDLDSGSGADRAAVLDETQERHGLTEEEAEEAVQGALMDGKCYEPDESSLKPI